MSGTVEHLPPDRYLGPRRFRITALCERCGKEFSWVTTKISEPDRPCPRKACKAAALEEEIMRRAENMAKIIAEQRAPATIGANPRIKAIDKTAEITMQDYGLTDLKDNVREGDIVAPALPARGQSGMKMIEAKDNFFGTGALKNTAMKRQAEVLGRMAINGAFAGMAANPGQLTRAPKSASPLTLVRTEKL